MKIILTEDVKKKGKKGEILNVKDGYGNFLIKQNQAVLLTDKSLSKLNKDNEKKEQKKLEENNNCNIVKKKLEKEKLEFKVKTGAQDKIFGTISPKQISNLLKEKGYESS